MFTEVIKIKNIWNFIDFSTKISLNKNNIFYALNSHWKTTLTSILNSIKDNDIDSLFWRKTLWVTWDIECIFKRWTDVFKIENKKWNKWTLELNNVDENIIVFDDNYINKHFFSEKIEREHEKNMHSLIFWKKWVDLNEDITSLNKRKKEKNDQLDKILLSFNLKAFSLVNYLKIKPESLNESELKIKLDTINKQILNIKQASTIKLKGWLLKLPVFSYDLLTIKEKFSNSKINSASHDFAKQKVLEYKKSRFHNHDKADDFIKYWVDNIIDNICPFCHQDLENRIDLFDTYKNYFDESYQKEFTELKSFYTMFNNYNFEADIWKMSSNFRENVWLFDFWRNNIQDLIDLFELSGIKDDINNIKEIKTNILLDLDNKIKDLNSDFNTINILSLIDSINNVNSLITSYNDIVDLINIKIDLFKKSLDIWDITEIEKERNKLEDQINRLSESEKWKIKVYNDLDLEISWIDKEIWAKKEELKNYTTWIITNYLSLINQKLVDIWINHFKIWEITPKTHVNGSYVEIWLLLNNLSIDLKNSSDNWPTFKNTLSRWDRNSLAFAFFLAYIEKLDNKQDLILIFDDPLSSHDENRQDATAFEIKKLWNQVKQLIILTHKKDFFRALNKKFKHDENTTYFEIKKNNLWSNIELLNPNVLLQNQIQRIINKFEDYIKWIPTDLRPDNLLNDIRKLFEWILRTKYYLKTRAETTIMQYDKLNKIFFNNNLLLNIKDDLIDLAQVSNDGSHEWYDTLNPEEVKTKVNKALKLIEQI